jgi:phenylalanyl-tRNA synthetase beta chain
MPKEVIFTLDGKERILHEEDLLICDDSGPIGIAGVMGGASTEVSDSSTRLLLEAAIFDPISIARTARRHKLSSEASRRFERGVDPQVSAVAAHRAAKLLEELAGGKISKLGANYAKVSPPLPIELPVSFPAALVGYDFQEKQVVDALELVGCELKMNSGTLLVQPPSWRPDLTDKTDLVEEVARLVGYSKIPATLPVAPPGTGLTKDQRLRRSVLNNLVGAGMVEVLNYPFVSSEQNQIFSAGNAVILENPLQLEFAEMRKDLLPGLMSAASRNLSRGMADLALIEEGSVFLLSANKPVTQLPAGNKRPSAEQLAQLNASIPHQPRHLAGLFLGQWLSQSPTSNSSESGYPQALSAVAAVARLLGLQIDISQEEVAGLHPGRGARLLVAGQVVGLAGELHPELAQANYLPRRVGVFEVDFSALCSLAPEVVAARQIRVMPALTQDLSLVVDQSVTAAELLRTIADACSELLESIRLVDQYQGEGIGATKKSLTFTLLFRSGEKTLTQAEANQLKLQAVEKCKAKFGAELRA